MVGPGRRSGCSGGRPAGGRVDVDAVGVLAGEVGVAVRVLDEDAVAAGVLGVEAFAHFGCWVCGLVFVFMFELVVGSLGCLAGFVTVG
jgi:hypothetical protein